MNIVKLTVLPWLIIGLATAPALADSQTLRQKFLAHMKAKSAEAQPVDPTQYVAGATQETLSYGSAPAQTIEVYAPPHPDHAPIIVMVHGGGWRIGDKNSPGVVDNKLKHWLPQGFIIVSVDYRMLPEAQVDTQARDVAQALAYVQTHAADWGGDPDRLILMGHSAGAHLVALLSADPAQVAAQGGLPWAGTVVLDSAGLDIAQVMGQKHMRLYDDAFGSDPAYWATVSPSARLKSDAVPMMLVCALKRPDDSCGQAQAFALQLKAIGQDAPVSQQDLTHMEVNKNLGLPGAYTDAVDAFIAARLH